MRHRNPFAKDTPLAPPYIGVVGDESLHPRAKIGRQIGHQSPVGIGKGMLRVMGSSAIAKIVTLPTSRCACTALAGEGGSKNLFFSYEDDT